MIVKAELRHGDPVHYWNLAMPWWEAAAAIQRGEIPKNLPAIRKWLKKAPCVEIWQICDSILCIAKTREKAIVRNDRFTNWMLHPNLFIQALYPPDPKKGRKRKNFKKP